MRSGVGMTKAKQAGTRFESAVRDFLRLWWPNVERRALAGNKDLGDLAGIPQLVVECKAAKAFDLAGWCDELEQERRNAKAMWAVLVVKRRNRNVATSYAVMPLDAWAALYHQATCNDNL